MIKSMTGYGRGDASSEAGEVTVELKSVNHRYREIYLRLPQALSSIEGRIRKAVEAVVTRGRVDVTVCLSWSGSEEGPCFEVNLPLARGYLSALEDLKEKLSLEGCVTVTDIATVKDVIMAREPEHGEDRLWEMIFPPLEEALRSLDGMKSEEGRMLAVDIRQRLENISQLVGAVSARRPKVVDLYREKLRQRITELLEDMEFDESRLAQEVAIMAERSDITEELVRIGSHLEQFYELLEKDGTVGRKLDFLIQEMNREINTIGSKSGDAEISKSVVEMKAELERIREQVQNIE